MADPTPRGLMSHSLTRANLARQSLQASRGKPTEKQNQLAYRDAVIDLHQRVADYFGDAEFQEKEHMK